MLPRPFLGRDGFLLEKLANKIRVYFLVCSIIVSYIVNINDFSPCEYFTSIE